MSLKRADRGREAFQEIDYSAMFGSIAKLAVEIDDAQRMVEITTRAFATALQGRMGPVVVSLPEDMLADEAGPRVPQAVTPAVAGLDPGFLAALAQRLECGSRPSHRLRTTLIIDNSSYGTIRMYQERN